ncbi:permeability factor 2-like [Myxocyprinus asiaticus]|uniref:permeability factor 2-like n=1 Tax=Myxocyprinus asiaticus TaxID=70543 RepID=UPI002222FDDC|nr:permeability factor 2-like [Myxocyprinus asiaticus]
MMKFTVAAFTFLNCMMLLSTTESRPLQQLRCNCINTYSGKPIPIQKIQALKVIPAGAHCKNMAIIATMKKGATCLNPTDKWVETLKEEMDKKNIKSHKLMNVTVL